MGSRLASSCLPIPIFKSCLELSSLTLHEVLYLEPKGKHAVGLYSAALVGLNFAHLIVESRLELSSLTLHGNGQCILMRDASV